MPPASTRPIRPAGEALLASRAAVVVVALVALSIGHVLLPAGASGRPPTGATTSRPEASFSRLDVAALHAGGATVVADDDERAAAASQAAADAELDAWGISLAVDPSVAAEPATPPAPPQVVRFRPRDGWTDVDRNARLSVRFTTAMDHATTEAAFHATLDGTDVAGSISWAEGDTVLVLRPSTALPYGARVELRVDGGALSATGSPIVEAGSARFTVAARPVARTDTASASSGDWSWPLIGPITQYFGQTLTKYGVHQGIDIDGDTGDPVTAARSGIVTVAGYADACGGLQVRIDHGGGIVSWYRHLSQIETQVGASVAAGTRIGRVGDTGCSIGSHLHFGVTVGGTFVDPLRYLPRH